MQTVDELKYSQSVWGFQPRKAEIRKVCDAKGLLRNRNHLDVSKDGFRQRCQVVPLVRKTPKCPDCGTEILLSSTGRERYVQGLPNGKLLTFFRLSVHQCRCHRCRKSFYESFPFLSSPKARITKALEQLMLKLRAAMSIKGVAEHFNISWDTVKDVEKRFLADKYRHVPLGKARGIAVDDEKVYPFRADKNGLRPHGGTRLAGAVRRDNGKLQRLLFLNLEAVRPTPTKATMPTAYAEPRKMPSTRPAAQTNIRQGTRHRGGNRRSDARLINRPTTCTGFRSVRPFAATARAGR